MRIRKHAKVSPLQYTSSSTLQNTTICQLNQSPWDVITFSPEQYYSPTPPPPPLHNQVEEEDSFLGNGSFCGSIGASESVASMKLSLDDDKEIWDYPDDDVAVDVEMNEVKVEEEEMFCEKIDAQGWQCHRLVKSGHTFCEHHKSLEHRRRGRPKKGSTSTDPNGYYYYSGFGPRWGKRRGADNDSSGNEEANITEMPPALAYGESDYMVDEEEEDGGGNGKKRARKPIKARSLKSLM